MLSIRWIGYGGNSFLAENLRPIINELGMELKTIHEWDSADIKWDQNTWLDELKKADIIIVPANWKQQAAKSNNRLTQSMALAKPVICSPSPAYLEILNIYPNAAIIADTEDEWKAALIKLRDDERLRTSMGKFAAEVAEKVASPKVILDKWIKAINANNDIVDIIIPSYKDEKYLKLCVESIKECTKFYNLIVVDSTNPRRNFSQAVNYGVSQGKAKYICILNSDLIVSRNWLVNMMENVKGNIVGCLSNCDKGFQHNIDINIGGVELLPGLNTIDEITLIINDIYNYKSTYIEIKQQQWTAAYCWLMERKTWNTIGILDEKFNNGCEDLDYCRRAKKIGGINIIQDYRSFIFHFGSISRKAYENEENTII